jgi:spore coat protein CotH
MVSESYAPPAQTRDAPSPDFARGATIACAVTCDGMPVTAGSGSVRFLLCARRLVFGIGIAGSATVVRLRVMVGVGAAIASLVSCGGNQTQPDGGQVTGGNNLACSDLFDPDVVRTYSLEIDPGEWQSIEDEFDNISELQSHGNDFAVYHPAIFHLDGETVANASVRLHGQSSWVQAVMFDDGRAKMQFAVAFDKVDPNNRFHGVDKLIFDMPRSDWTFMHERLAHEWLRRTGIMTGCAASARLNVNGSYYGLFVVMEDVGKSVLKRFFPGNYERDLWKAGEEPETNKAAPDQQRRQAFWDAKDLTAVSAIVDLPGSVNTWAAEALLNNADGYYGGFHNFFIYDQGSQGFIFLPLDLDATFDWLALFDQVGATDHPVFWWEARAKPVAPPGHVWSIVMSDAGWRRKYADAMAALLAKWDVAEIQGRIDSWAKQIAPHVAEDPRKWATPDQFNMAVQMAKEVVASRPAYLRTFVECEQNGTGDDKDGDGARWCDDCRDDNASIHVGAAEMCNGVDDNCNGLVDEGC